MTARVRTDLPTIPREEVLARIMPRLDRSGDCWNWTGGTSGDGYGRAQFGGRTFSIHRLMHSLHNGPIPAGMLVRHTCDNPPCCNPEHLLLGTDRDNVRDREERGRGVQPRVSGVEHWNARHDAEFVRRVVEEYATGLYSQVELGRRYGISPSTVSYWSNRRLRRDAFVATGEAS